MQNDMEVQKAIGRLEKGVDVLEKAMGDMKREHRDHSAQVLGAIAEMRDDFKQDMEKFSERVDVKITTLHTQLDGVTNNHTNLRLSVQKLAGTVSVVVGVGLYLLKAAFDAAKDVLLHQ